MNEYFKNFLETFRPNEYLDSIYQVDFTTLRKKGIKALILDLDETLLPKELLEISPVLFSFIEGIKDKGFSIYLMSNSSKEKRVEHVASTFKIPYMTYAMKPLPFSYNSAMKELGVINSETAVIGDQLFMDILGGNWARMYTIMVRPMNPEKLWIRKVMRQAEDWVLKQLSL
ncbi:YqeG family HAD IIIA-type phosphatase [Candidatus Saganbacteria bacterium]|nr:YqeG family HAD IIIA-type phosphatase [Candidatus Saganbacteria bacterium]